MRFCSAAAGRPLARVVELMVTYLKEATNNSLYNIMQRTMQELAPLFAGGSKFAVQLTKYELASLLLPTRFMRPINTPGTTSEHPKGLLSPLCSAVGDLSVYTYWSPILTGPGASESKIQSLKTNLGKLALGADVISDAGAFPLWQSQDIFRGLERHDISGGPKEHGTYGCSSEYATSPSSPQTP